MTLHVRHFAIEFPTDYCHNVHVLSSVRRREQMLEHRMEAQYGVGQEYLLLLRPISDGNRRGWEKRIARLSENQVVKGAALVRGVLLGLLHDHLPSQPHEAVGQGVVARGVAAGLGDGGGADVVAAILDGGGGVDGADGAVELVLLEGLHADGHGVSAEGEAIGTWCVSTRAHKYGDGYYVGRKRREE